MSGYFGSIANLRSAQDENQQLKQRVQELEVELKAKEDLAAENQRLGRLLDLKEKSQYKVLTARIIGRDPSIWFDSSIVNRGSLDGVKLNMPVVTNGGLLGRVTAVGPLTSQVDLITRDKSGVGAVVGEIAGSSALGVVVGTSKRGLVEMRYVPGSVEVHWTDRAEAYRQFRGRDPDVNALLKRRGFPVSGTAPATTGTKGERGR